MKILIVLVLLIIAAPSNAQNYTIQPHDELQGIRFEEIGELKLITQLREINFIKNLTQIEDSLNLIAENLENFRNFEINDEDYQKRLSKIAIFVEAKRTEYLDMTCGFRSRRSKRTTNEKLQTFHKTLQDVHNDIFDHQKRFHEATRLNNKTSLKIVKSNYVHQVQWQARAIEILIEAIFSLQTHRRLVPELIDFDEFEMQLAEINASLSADEELPSDVINKYFYSLDTAHQIFNRTLIITVKIPVIRKQTFNVHKIVTYPARIGSSLVLTKVPFKFIANSSNHFTFFSSLDDCIAFQPYLCEPETSIHTTNDDCLTHTFSERQIKPELCDTISFETKHLMIVQLSNNDFFYYAPSSEDFIDITCDSVTKSENLTQTGILHLGMGCVAKTSKYTLVPAHMHYVKSENVNFLEVGFSREELEKLARGEKSFLTENVFFENLGKLEFREKKDMKEVPLLEADFWDENKFYFLGAFVIALLVILCLKRCLCCGCL